MQHNEFSAGVLLGTVFMEMRQLSFPLGCSGLHLKSHPQACRVGHVPRGARQVSEASWVQCCGKGGSQEHAPSRRRWKEGAAQHRRTSRFQEKTKIQVFRFSP